VTKTAEQRRADERIMYDAFMAACPTRHVFATIGDKWAGLIVNALADGPRRHGELRVRIAGASQKMLTQTLRTLERNGLVTRTLYPTIPPRVDYELTDLGRSLQAPVVALGQWAFENIPQIDAARAAFDARTEG
jgi:DNA-binding HxlR family transcriptional regulator